MEKNEILALIESMGITYTAEFVPFSHSRNAKEKQVSLNWIVTLSKGRETLVTDYMQGIAHLPKSSKAQLADKYQHNKDVSCACETGKFPQFNRSSFHKVSIPAPELVDVLYSLVSDSDVLNHSTFESWASDYGYDVDSRQTEKIYHGCLKIALSMRGMIGDSGMQALRDAYQDY